LASTRGTECSGLATRIGDLTMQGSSQFDRRFPQLGHQLFQILAALF